jgi:Type II secretory pathway, component PulF
MPTIKTGFPKRNRKISLFSLYEWKSLISLLEQQRSFGDCLKLLKNEKNTNQITEIQSMLTSGNSIVEVFDVVSDSFTSRMSFLLKAMPFVNALKVSIKMKEFELETIKKLQQILLYPSFVIVFSLVVLLSFTNFIVPNILEMFSDMDMQTVFLATGIKTVNFIVYSLVSIAILFVFYYVSFVRKKGAKKLQKFAKLLHFDNLLGQFTSYMFSQYLIVLMENGLSFRQSMQLLVDHSYNELVSYAAGEVDKLFLKGNSLEKVVDIEGMDEYFCLLCQIGYETGNVKESFEEYGVRAELRLKELLKKVSFWIQTISYLGIGIVVVVVYQIMLLPLNVLETY